jgi:hypothetical protein
MEFFGDAVPADLQTLSANTGHDYAHADPWNAGHNAA